MFRRPAGLILRRFRGAALSPLLVVTSASKSRTFCRRCNLRVNQTDNRFEHHARKYTDMTLLLRMQKAASPPPELTAFRSDRHLLVLFTPYVGF